MNYGPLPLTPAAAKPLPNDKPKAGAPPAAKPAAAPVTTAELSQALAQANRTIAQQKAQIAGMTGAVTSATWEPGAWLQWLIANWATAQKFIALYQEWQTITQPITDKTGMKSRIVVALECAQLIATLTPDTSDDAIVATIQNLLITEGGVDVLLDLIWAIWKPGTTAPAAIGPLESHFQGAALGILKDRAAARKINWGNLLQLLPTIISIIQIFTGVKIPLPTLPAPAPTT